MRIYLLPLLLLSLPSLLLSQDLSGIIHFQEVVKLEIDLPEEVKAMAIELPTEQTNEFELYYSADESLFKNKKSETGPETIEGGGGDVQVRMVRATPENQVYKQFSSGEQIEMKEFFGKKFLIKGEQKSYSWKITGEDKTILDMACMKAVHSDSSGTIEAWFSPELTISSGPASLGGLPGMILEASFDDGKRTITATDIEQKPLQAEHLQAPTKGKSVTSEEYDAIVEAKMKEMEEEMGGSGGQVRIIRRN